MAEMHPGALRAVSWVLGGILIVGAVAGALAKLPTAPVIVLVITGGLLQVLPTVVALLQGSRERQTTDQREMRSGTAGAMPPSLVRDISPRELRVHAAVREDVGYIVRDREPDVVEQIRIDRRVLIVGPSMSGKTSLALSAAKGARREYTFYEPNDGKSLHERLVKGDKLENTLVWLDELQRFVGAGGLTAVDLTALMRCPTVVIVATITTSEYDSMQTRRDVTPPGWDVRAWFRFPILLDDWSDDELSRLATTRIGSQVLEEARRYGLSQYLGGAPLIIDELNIAPTARPDGYAVVRAIVDWRRAGIERSMPRAQLESVYDSYATVKHAQPLASQLDDALEWATRFLNQTVALVTDEGTGYRALDLVMDQLADSPPAPPKLWSTVLEFANDRELIEVGFRASSKGLTAVARRAFQKAATAGNPAAMAIFGTWLTELDPPDLAGGHKWLEKAATAGSVGAMLNLGLVLQKLDPPDLTGARAWLEKAAAAGEARAMYQLVILLFRLDKGDPAIGEWLGNAVQAGDPQALALHDRLAAQLMHIMEGEPEPPSAPQ